MVHYRRFRDLSGGAEHFEGTRKVFSFHEKYERYLNCLASCAGILLVNPMEGKRAGDRNTGYL